MNSIEARIIMNRGLSGDRDSLFLDIWKGYRKRLYYYVTAVIGSSREDGEDLLQEIMLKVYNNLDQYRTGRSFNAWIYAIARNHCLDYKRKNEARPFGEEYRDSEGEAPEPFEAVCIGELNRAIRKCLETMDEVDREMIFLRHFEGLKYKHIGAVVGMNVNSVKTRTRTAERRLRLELKEWL